MPNSPELQEIARLAADARATAEATLNGLSDAQLAWTPGGDRWSAAMIADHLVRGNDAVLPKLREAVESAPPADGTPHPRFTLMERLFIGALTPGTKIRVPVPPGMEPEPPQDPRAAVAAFFRVHDAMVAIAEEAGSHRLAGVKITSPVNSLVRLHVVPYLHALFQHERYHLEQVKILIEEPGFPRQ